MRPCPDCQVKPGELHRMGCDVERCCLCGEQRISCDCVYKANGMNVDTLEQTHPQVYNEGPTKAMCAVVEAEEKKYGGRLPWTGQWPDEDACIELGLYSYWGDRETKEPMEHNNGRLGTWFECSKDHPGAGPDLNRLSSVARWDKEKRRWVPIN